MTFDWNHAVDKLFDPAVMCFWFPALLGALRLNINGVTKADPHFQKGED